MDLSTDYLGLRLAHPIMPGASPLVDDLDTVRRLEDAGAAAIVMHSLFEEQVRSEQMAALRHLDAPGESSAEALSYFPVAASFGLGSEEYLDRLRRIREAVAIPVIASLNGSTPGGWLEYARNMEQAGAHALELNLYTIPTDAREDATAVDRAPRRRIVRGLQGALRIPVAVKLSPFYSSLPAFVRRLEEAGARRRRTVQPLLPARHRPRGAGGRRARSSSRTPPSCRSACGSSRSSPGSVRLSLAATGGVHSAHRRAEGDHGRGARRPDGLGAASPRARAPLDGDRRPRRWLEEHEYASLRAGDRQHEPRALPRPGGVRARELRPGPRVLARLTRRPARGGSRRAVEAVVATANVPAVTRAGARAGRTRPAAGRPRSRRCRPSLGEAAHEREPEARAGGLRGPEGVEDLRAQRRAGCPVPRRGRGSRRRPPRRPPSTRIVPRGPCASTAFTRRLRTAWRSGSS